MKYFLKLLKKSTQLIKKSAYAKIHRKGKLFGRVFKIFYFCTSKLQKKVFSCRNYINYSQKIAPMKHLAKLAVFAFLPLFIAAQEIAWEDVSSNYELPEGLKLFHGTKSGSTTFFAYYYEVDMNVPEIAIRPYLSASSMQVHNFSGSVGAYGAVNGGFFSGSTSVSSVVFPNEVPARNLISVVRNSQTYPVIRPIFALNNDRSLSTEWVYHHSYAFDDIYVYDQPLQYECNDPNPLPVPLKADGLQYEDIAFGLGGGPMLVKDGENVFTWCEEIWWGSGVDLNVNRPRTAVGYTLDNRVIILVTNSMKVEDLPDLMIELGCHGAMNLDGGGSTAMAVGGTSIYDQNRAVPTILAIVHTDSLGLPQTPTWEKFMDTGDEEVTSNGEWFATANDGFWVSPSMLHPLATHDEYYDFPLNLPAPGEYEIYGWWTAHPNRAADTPYFVTHANGTTEVAMDQTIGGSMWNLVGTFEFAGTEDEKVRITAGANTNQFVVADGLRIVSYNPQFASNFITQISGVPDISVPFGTSLDDALALLAPSTTIMDSEGATFTVELSWQAEGYDGNTPGDYPATGTFELPEGVGQTTPPTPLEVTAIITVLEADDTSIFELSSSSFHLFPNPSAGTVNISGKFAGAHTLEILTTDGKSVYSATVSGNTKQEINFQEIQNGLYLVRVTGPSANMVKKLIIQK